MDGLAVESHRLLILSRTLDVDRRSEIAFHEYLHAWGFHVPQPSNEEERCNLASMARQQFDRDLDAAGGEGALRTLPPTKLGNIGHSPTAKVRALSDRETIGPADRIPCATCESPVLCGDIDHGEPFLHEHTKQFRVERWFRCESCGSLQVWLELCAPDGAPSGEFVSIPKPRILRGAEASAWLADRSRELQKT
jgi:hypothetical protein